MSPKTYNISVLETWHRRGTVSAESLEELADIVLNQKDSLRILWHDPEYLSDQYDNPEYLAIFLESRTEARTTEEEIYRGDGRDLLERVEDDG